MQNQSLPWGKIFGVFYRKSIFLDLLLLLFIFHSSHTLALVAYPCLVFCELTAIALHNKNYNSFSVKRQTKLSFLSFVLFFSLFVFLFVSKAKMFTWISLQLQWITVSCIKLKATKIDQLQENEINWSQNDQNSKVSHFQDKKYCKMQKVGIILQLHKCKLHNSIQSISFF